MAQQNDTTVQPCTLENYAALKSLPFEELREHGLKDQSHEGKDAIRIPYWDQDESELAVRYRTALQKPSNPDAPDNRFRWKSGSKAQLYGLWRVGLAKKKGYAFLVEGESDCHTLWHYGEPAFGIPGASIWRDEWNSYFEPFEVIYVVVEPDKGGESLRKRVEELPFRERVKIVHIGNVEGVKDVSDLHCKYPDQFVELLKQQMEVAESWQDYESQEENQRRSEAWEQCHELADQEDILAALATSIETQGVVGVRDVVKTLYLALVSRLLDRPVSVAVKAVSSAGKSFAAEMALTYFPASTYHALSAMSERALAYDDQPLKHRFLVIYEAEGLQGDMANYLIRSLLSEGRVRYLTVEKTSKGMRPRLIEREGPTGLLVTTTKISLHPENETRLLSLTVPDTQQQTKGIMRSLATEERAEVDMVPWHALQEWLTLADNRVVIPYALVLAELMPPVSVRLRRDFKMILSLIRAHAILHQATRERDEQGRIIATLNDYETVRRLVAPLLAEGVELIIPKEVRETVKTIEEMKQEDTQRAITYAALGRKLGLDKSSGKRRAEKAIDLGFIKNEAQDNKPADLNVAEALPQDKVLLPSLQTLSRGCEVAEQNGDLSSLTTEKEISDEKNEELLPYSDNPSKPPCPHAKWNPIAEGVFVCMECKRVWNYGGTKLPEPYQSAS